MITGYKHIKLVDIQDGMFAPNLGFIKGVAKTKNQVAFSIIINDRLTPISAYGEDINKTLLIAIRNSK